jgi:predicted amidohydrolase YtcJ
MMRSVTLAIAGILAAAGLCAQSPDTILVNGKILSADAAFSTRQALAIRDGKIAATGSTAEIQRLAGPKTRVIDLAGRTMIPGLIDSHMHAIRAALSFATEVNWIGAPSITDAVGRIREAARSKEPGSWLIVAGGWTPQQFRENRLPTQAELVEAAPSNPVYVQLGYGWAMLTPLALQALKINGDADAPLHGKLERDAAGKLTGAISGGQDAIISLFDRLPLPNFAQQVEGTRKFFRELNRLGLTGVVDPGGNNVTPQSYEAVFKVWREGHLTLRVAYALCGMTPGKEFDEYKSMLQLLPMGFGDDMLRFNGLGERVTWAMNNNTKPTAEEAEKYFQIVKWAAERGMSVTMHSNNDVAANVILAIFERMKALGVGWTVQDANYFGGERFLKQNGAAAARRSPPVETAKEIGVAIGAGTDAHRVASYNPFTALQWFLDGKTVGGVALRGPEETPDRADALRFYTQGSAWFAHDETTRGSLEAGKLADLAVLSKDYMTVPVDQVGGLESLLTMVGGKVVYASGPFAKLEEAR